MQRNSINRLFEQAKPVQLEGGAFKDVVGIIKYSFPEWQDEEIQTYVMTSSTDFEVKNKGKKHTYILKEGYILVQPFVDFIVKKFPDTPHKDIKAWKRSNKKYIDERARGEDLHFVPLITIKGSNCIQGTYFHPEVFVDVLVWACPRFKEHLKDEFYHSLYRYNQQLRDLEQQQEQERHDTQALTYQNLQQYEVNAPYMFEEELLSDIEEDKNDVQLTDVQSMCLELENLIKQLQLQMDKSTDINELRSLAAKQSALKDELREYEKRAALQQDGAIYTLNWRSDDSVMYVGLTAQTSKGIKAAPGIRFQQHKQKVVDVFKNSDIAHIVLAGEVAKHIIQHKLTKVTTSLVDAIVYPTFVCGAKYNPGELEAVETAKIQQFIQEGHTIYNSRKRADVERSNTRNGSLDSGFQVAESIPRLQRMREASRRSDAVSVPRPVEQVRQQYIQEKFVMREVEETAREKQKRQACIACNKMIWPSRMQSHNCKPVKQ